MGCVGTCREKNAVFVAITACLVGSQYYKYHHCLAVMAFCELILLVVAEIVMWAERKNI